MSEGIEEKLDRYGESQHEFLACGELIGRDNKKFEATAHIRQLTNGRLLVGFVLVNPLLAYLLDLFDGVLYLSCGDSNILTKIFTKFDGHLKDTRDEVTIPLKFPPQEWPLLPSPNEDEVIIYQVPEIEIGKANFGETTVKTISYEICNFYFLGTEAVPRTVSPQGEEETLYLSSESDLQDAIKDGKYKWISVLPLRIDKFDFQITQSLDYAEAIKEITARKNVRKTSEITIRTQIGSKEDLDLITKRVDEVCALLSIARGTLITWTSLRYTNDEQKDHQYRYFRYSLTRPYSSISTIKEHPPEATKEFVETGFEKLQQKDNKINIIEFASEFTETRGPSFLVTQTLLAAVLVERFAKQNAPKPLPLKDSLSVLNKELKLGYDEGKLKKIIDIRNELAHEGRFLPNKDEIEQWKLVIGLLDTITLKTLGYQGEYVDWRSIDYIRF